MFRLVTVSALSLALLVPTALAAESGFNPLRIARDAAELGLDTAKKAVDLGLDTAEDAADVAEDAVTIEDNCPAGERYKGRDGRWHTCD